MDVTLHIKYVAYVLINPAGIFHVLSEQAQNGNFLHTELYGTF